MTRSGLLADHYARPVAKMMVQNNCGEIPVVDMSDRPIGVITDATSSAASSPKA
jgi:CBS domain-containing protein